eukprot:1157179-Pelagomonas_calceolata.AAC.17
MQRTRPKPHQVVPNMQYTINFWHRIRGLTAHVGPSYAALQCSCKGKAGKGIKRKCARASGVGDPQGHRTTWSCPDSCLVIVGSYGLEKDPYIVHLVGPHSMYTPHGMPSSASQRTWWALMAHLDQAQKAYVLTLPESAYFGIASMHTPFSTA